MPSQSFRRWKNPWGLVCLILPVIGLAQPTFDTWRSHIDEARRLYANLEYERALEQLALAQSSSRADQGTLTILLYKGIILSDMGRPEEAFAAFQAALQLRPDAQLPMMVSPKIQRLFDHMRKVAIQNSVKTQEQPEVQAPEQVKLRPPAEPTPPPGQPKALPVGTPQSALSDSHEARQGGSMRRWSWIPMTAGTVALGGGLYFFLNAEGKYKRLNGDEPLSAAEAETLRRDGKRQQNLAWVSTGVGGALPASQPRGCARVSDVVRAPDQPTSTTCTCTELLP
jgi:tetratricopeptide (TPR) repeat protein